MTMSLPDLYQASELLLLGGDADEALVMLAQAAEQAPDDPEPCLRMGEICLSLGDVAHLQQAEAHLVKAVALGDGSAPVYFKLMRVHVEQGRYAEAQAAYDAALRASPEDMRLREWGVRLALAVHDVARALALVRAERAAAPENFFWHRWEAELLMALDDLPAARHSFDALIARHRPVELAAGDWDAANWGAIHMQRGGLALTLGDLALAEEDSKQAQALIIDDPAITFFYGRVLWAKGERDAAREVFQQVLQAAPPAVRFGFERQLDGIIPRE